MCKYTYPLPKTVYHGSISIYREDLLKGIDVTRGQNKVDFGKGFYVTSNYEQAVRWAKKRAVSWNEFHEGMGQRAFGFLTTYEVDIEKLYGLNGRFFPYESYRWTKFVLRNRSQPSFHGFDYIMGPVADGMTKGLIDDHVRGKISIEELKRGLTGKYRNSSQLSIHTQASVESLTLVEEVIHNDIDFEEKKWSIGS